MNYIVLVSCLLFVSLILLISLNVYKKWFNPMTFFASMYFIIILFSSFRFFGYYEVSIETYIFITLGVVCFCLGCILPTRNNTYVVRHVRCTKTVQHNKMLLKRVIICDIILLVTYICELVNVSYYFISGFNYSYIRGVYFAGNSHLVIGTIQFWELFRTYISYPLMIAIMIISVMWLLLYRNWKQFVVSIFIILMHLIISFSRFTILYLAVALIFTYVIAVKLTNNVMFDSRRISRIVKRLSILAIFGILMVTISRGAEKLFESIYEYFFGCVFLLDQLLLELPEKLTMGVVSIKAIIAPIYTMLHHTFNIPYSQFYYTALNTYALKENAHVISDNGQVTNAFGTFVFALYSDFRIWGIVIGMSLFGCLSAHIYRKMYREINEKNIALYIIVVIAMVKSIQEYPLSTEIFVFTVLYIFLLYRGNVTCSFVGEGES